jgi:hypothetical protein
VGEASESVESLTTLAKNAEIAANLAEAAAVSADASNASAVASAASAFESAQTAKMEAEVAASYSISAGEFSDDAVMSADKARASEESAAESEIIANEHRISAENASASASESKEKAEAAANKAESIVGEIGILNSTSGENILLTDSTENEFKGLTVYGKSTQDGTPTPEAPIPIVSAGASGSVEVKVYGANLYTGENNAMSCSLNPTTGVTQGNNNNYFVTDYIEVLPNTEYYITEINTFEATVGTMTRCCCYDSNRNFINTVYENTRTEVKRYSRTIVFPENAKYIRIQFRKTDTDIAICLNEFQTLTLATPNELRSVPVNNDYTGDYILENGKRRVCDYIDLVVKENL